MNGPIARRVKDIRACAIEDDSVGTLLQLNCRQQLKWTGDAKYVEFVQETAVWYPIKHFWQVSIQHVYLIIVLQPFAQKSGVF